MVKELFKVVAAWKDGTTVVEIRIPWYEELGAFEFGDAVDVEPRTFVVREGRIEPLNDGLGALVDELGLPDDDPDSVMADVPDEIEIVDEFCGIIYYSYNRMLFKATKNGITIYCGEDTPGDRKWACEHDRVKLLSGSLYGKLAVNRV